MIVKKGKRTYMYNKNGVWSYETYGIFRWALDDLAITSSQCITLMSPDASYTQCRVCWCCGRVCVCVCVWLRHEGEWLRHEGTLCLLVLWKGAWLVHKVTLTCFKHSPENIGMKGNQHILAWS